MPYNVDVNNMVIVEMAGFIPLLAMMIIYHAATRSKDSKGHTKTAAHHIGGVYIFCFVLVWVFYLTGIPGILHLAIDPKINLTPLYTVQTTFHLYSLNILLFAPIGFLLPTLWKKFRNVFRTLLCGFLFSLFIEILQLLNSRITDIDDLITNTVGTLIGYLVFMILKLAIPKISSFAIDRKERGNHETFVCFFFTWLSMFFIRPFVSAWIWGILIR